VRQGDWKLINSAGWTHTNFKLNAKNIAEPTEQYVYPKGLLLFNLKDDIGETKNLAAKHPKRVAAMTKLYENWIGQMKKRSKKKKK